MVWDSEIQLWVVLERLREGEIKKGRAEEVDETGSSQVSCGKKKRKVRWT